MLDFDLKSILHDTSGLSNRQNLLRLANQKDSDVSRLLDFLYKNINIGGKRNFKNNIIHQDSYNSFKESKELSTPSNNIQKMKTINKNYFSKFTDNFVDD